MTFSTCAIGRSGWISTSWLERSGLYLPERELARPGAMAAGTTVPLGRAEVRTFAGSAAWMRNGVLSLVEQGLASCSNQVIGIVVARSIDPTGYGAFTLAFTILLM